MAAQAEFFHEPRIPAAATALAEDSGKLLAEFTELVVSSDLAYETAGGDLKRIADKEREIEAMRKDMKAPILKAGKMVDAFFAVPLEKLATAKGRIKRAMLVYQDEQERKRREEEARIRELQRQEQERLAKEAEAAEREARRLAEEAAAKEREAAAMKNTEARRQAEEEAARLRAEAEQNRQTANAVIEQAAEMPAAIVTRELPKTAGVDTRRRWVPEQIGTLDEAKMEVFKAIVAGRIPLIAGDINMTFIRQQAISLKSAFNIPGFRAVEQKGISA